MTTKRNTAMLTRLLDTATETLADNRQVRVICSTDSVDRVGDIIDQKGIDLTQYRKNPVVLWGHNPNMPVARCIDIGLRNNRLEATVQFPAEGEDEDADWCYGKIKSGLVNATSVGFRPLKDGYEPLDAKQPWNGFRFLKTELFEFSFVSVPANQDALIIGRDIIRGALMPPPRSPEPVVEPEVTPEIEPKAMGEGSDGNIVGPHCAYGADEECGMKDPLECSVHRESQKVFKGGRRVSKQNVERLSKAMEHIKAVMDSNDPDNDGDDDAPGSQNDPDADAQKRARDTKLFLAGIGII